MTPENEKIKTNNNNIIATIVGSQLVTGAQPGAEAKARVTPTVLDIINRGNNVFTNIPSQIIDNAEAMLGLTATVGGGRKCCYVSNRCRY